MDLAQRWRGANAETQAQVRAEMRQLVADTKEEISDDQEIGEPVGASGGAIACAISVVVVETVTTGLMLRALGRLAVDARLVSVCLRTLLTGAIVVAFDYGLRRAGLPGWPRVGLVVVAWVGVAFATRSVRLSDVKMVVRLARAQRAAKTA